ncbi:MAG: acetate kinase [Spirochaetales bacterium]|nr:MAG: acetate kinase [Spirochaetales bacterium]
MSAKILVINCGSSSLKYEIYEMPERNSLGKGIIERIGEPLGVLRQESAAGVLESSRQVKNHEEAIAAMGSMLIDGNKGIVSSLSEISGVGHRVVHGGEECTSSVLIDEHVRSIIRKNIELAPLHNPANLAGIEEVSKLLPRCSHVAVFDTSFHQTMPPAAYLYGLPRELYDKYKIRRYGFHGTSHRYVAAEAVKLCKRSMENTNIISCHLGNGASITAIAHGVSIDTSMGFTPLEGLMMGTRSGDIDPAIIFFLLERGYTEKDLNDMLNKKSGLLGLSGISNDLRDLEAAVERGDSNAKEALEVYAYRIRKYIGAYAANIVKVDILVFTGGIGTHGFRMRERICHRLENLGMFMDYSKNKDNGSMKAVISTPFSPITIAVIPTNEELQIAVDAFDILFKAP